MADQDSAMFKYHFDTTYFVMGYKVNIYILRGQRYTFAQSHTNGNSRIHCLFEHKQNTIATHVHVGRQDSVCTNGNF